MDIRLMIENSGIKKLLSDKLYLSIKYRTHFGHWMDWNNPQTYNEKLQWLKLYDRNPAYIPMADKYEVKELVAKKIGREHVIPTYGVWDNFDEIDFSKLPDQFVLKCTHDSGSIVICKNKSSFDVESARTIINRGLKSDPYTCGREWVYKDIKPRIIAEKFIKPSEGEDLKDYKFFCFDGEPKMLFVASDRFSKDIETSFDYFDMDFNHLDVRNGHPNCAHPVSKPETFDKMKQLASKLSQGIPHVRVDFYDVDGDVLFGEFTFYHLGGAMNFEPGEWDLKFGQYITLPQKK